MSKSVVILGGGIGGLSLAHFINSYNYSSEFRQQIKRKHGVSRLKIHLYESSPKFGGWMQTSFSPPISSLVCSSPTSGTNFSSSFEMGGGRGSDTFLYETGPHSIPLFRSKNLLEIISSIELCDRMTFSPPKLDRFILNNRHLNTPVNIIKRNIPSLIFPVLRDFFSVLHSTSKSSEFKSKELQSIGSRIYSLIRGDEISDMSIYSYFEQRIGTKMTDLMATALVSGIFAGDPNYLSMRSCFPELWERTYETGSGSLFRSFFNLNSETYYKKAKANHFIWTWLNENNLLSPSINHSTAFSFFGGMSELIERLSEHLERDIDLNLNHKVVSIQYNKFSKKFLVGVENSVGKIERIESDYLFSCIPSFSLSQILKQSPKDSFVPSTSIHRFDEEDERDFYEDLNQEKENDKREEISYNEKWKQELTEILDRIKFTNVSVVNLGYSGLPAPIPGFGYLVPSSESLPILGCIFHSNTFPQQNSRTDEQTRLTYMIGGSEINSPLKSNPSDQQIISYALEAAKRDLLIQQKPDFINFSYAKKCIPQYHVDYHLLLEQLEKNISHLGGRFQVGGQSFYGVGICSTVNRSKFLAQQFAKDLKTSRKS